MWGIVFVTTAGHCGLSAGCGWKLSYSAESASDRERLVESARILAAVAIKQHQFNSNESISLLTTKRVAVLSRMVRFGVKYRSLKTNKILENVARGKDLSPKEKISASLLEEWLSALHSHPTSIGTIPMLDHRILELSDRISCRSAFSVTTLLNGSARLVMLSTEWYISRWPWWGDRHVDV